MGPPWTLEAAIGREGDVVLVGVDVPAGLLDQAGDTGTDETGRGGGVATPEGDVDAEEVGAGGVAHVVQLDIPGCLGRGHGVLAVLAAELVGAGVAVLAHRIDALTCPEIGLDGQGHDDRHVHAGALVGVEADAGGHLG